MTKEELARARKFCETNPVASIEQVIYLLRAVTQARDEACDWLDAWLDEEYQGCDVYEQHKAKVKVMRDRGKKSSDG